MAYSTISKPSLHFNTKLYTGTGSSNAITGVGFQPDWVWIKERNASSSSHNLTDSVRGAGKGIFSNDTSAEYDYGTGTSGSVRSFDSNGFTLGTASQVNPNGVNMVSWNWKASNSAGSSNSDGSITSTVSANTTAGFSIVSYTGTGSNATVGHGLGVAPKLIFIKNRDDAGGQSWSVYNKNIGNTKYLKLDTNSAEDTNTTRFNSTDPTSTVFSLGTHASGNASGEKIIAYCFAEKKGFSKFSTYIGNGNDDGTFVYCGFKPQFVMVKASSGADSWQMTDHPRDKDVSPNFARLLANATSTESTNTTWAKIEKFSNGFKMAGTDGVSNQSGRTYLFMAYAEEPLVANVGASIPATAR